MQLKQQLTGMMLLGLAWMMPCAYAAQATAPVKHIKHTSHWQSPLGNHKSLDNTVNNPAFTRQLTATGQEIENLRYQKTIATLQNDIMKLMANRKLLSVMMQARIDKALGSNIRPSQPSPAAPQPTVQAKPMPVTPKLAGVFIKGHFKRASISISGQYKTVDEGQTVAGYTVKHIDTDKVTLVSQQGKKLILTQMSD